MADTIKGTDNRIRWIDASGDAVLIKFVPTINRVGDKFIERNYKKAVALQKRMEKFDREMRADFVEWLDYLAQGTESRRPSKKGNVSITNFTANRKIMLEINEFIAFDERIQTALDLLSEIKDEWVGNSSEEIRFAIDAAFKVNVGGNVSTTKLLGLRKWNITHPLWKQAMDVVADSLITGQSRSYLRIKTRKDKGSEWKTLRLDMAGVHGIFDKPEV